MGLRRTMFLALGLLTRALGLVYLGLYLERLRALDLTGLLTLSLLLDLRPHSYLLFPCSDFDLPGVLLEHFLVKGLNALDGCLTLL